MESSWISVPSGAGPPAPGPMSLPRTMVEETVEAGEGNQHTDAAAAPYSESSQPPPSDSSSDESDRWTSNRPLNSKRREDELKLLSSADDDSDEKTEARRARDPNWRWPAYDEVYHSGERDAKFVKRRYADKAPMPPKAVTRKFPFQIIYHNTKAIVLWPDRVSIKFKSPHLLTLLRQYLPDERNLRYKEKVDVSGRKVYVILEELKKHQLSSNADGTPSTIPAVALPTENGSLSQSEQNGASRGVSSGHANLAAERSEIDSKGAVSRLEGKKDAPQKTREQARLHLQHLVRFLDEEYATVALRKQHMKEDKSVSFDMLWAFLTPGTKVVYRCTFTQEQLCAKVVDSSYSKTNLCGKIFKVELAFWDYNCVAYRSCETQEVIGQYAGEKPFDTLGVFPIDMDRTTSPEALKAKFLARGRRFRELAMRSSNCFQHYNGATLRVRGHQIVKERADGRVMIDLKSFAVMNPNYRMGTAQPPVSHEISHKSAGASVEKSSQEVEDENLIFAPAIVYGFSFTLKLWGAFAVTGFSEINFDSTAFDDLVMEPELKGLLYSLVTQFVATPTFTSGPASSAADLPRVDPIANKGEGCIFLCYGPPGTGKTLTAESLAENLRRPLWSLSVAELGTTPADLEKTLLKVLEIAAMWKAVLLLDEADVYLEKRVSATDLTRNAMTGVFLRLLEYYKGVLFLTTNRITTFDDAFRSRISLMLCYPKLDAERREQIWRTALVRVQAGKVGPEFLAELARHRINGREIRNAIHLAHTLARSNNEELQERHLRLVMNVVTQTSETLNAVLRDV